jgi:NitT/TauT family transport system permease protein
MTRPDFIGHMSLHRFARSVVLPFLIFVVFVGAWEAGARAELFPAYVLPAPSAIAERCGETADIMIWHCLVTCEEVLLGFLLAVVVGIFLAAVIVYVKLLEEAVYPWLIVIQVVPKVALGPLLVVWLGVGFLPKVMISFLLAFFPVMIDAIVGLRSIHRDSVFLLKSMGASRAKRFYYMQLPNALPHIFGALKVSITLAAVGAIVGEFIGADKGLGYVLVVATGTLDTVLIFVALVWITAMSLVLFAVIALLEKVCVSWHSSMRHDRVVASG